MFRIISSLIKEKKQNYVFLVMLFLSIVFLVNVPAAKVLAGADNADKFYVIKKDGKYGYMDIKGNVVIEPVYYDARDFSEGVAPVRMGDKTWGIINTKGKVITTWEDVDEIDSFSEGLAVARKERKYGYIDKTKQVIDFKFDNAKAFSEGLAVVKIRGGDKGKDRDYGYIDKKGNIVIDCNFFVAGDFKEGVAAVLEPGGSGWGYIDKTGQYAMKPQYFTAREFSEGIAPVTIALGKSGFIDHRGNLVIPPQYSWTYSFSEGLARVMVGNEIQMNPFKVISKGKYGFIDKSGKMVIHPAFDEVDNFKNGLARVHTKAVGNNEYQHDGFRYIDKNGKVIWE